MQLYAGTSGYAYDFWKGSFYPEDIDAGDMLTAYADKLNTVEINNTFYRIPKPDVVRRWSDAVPEGFRFVIKASRRITHQSRLSGCEDTVSYMYSVLEPLEDKLGAVLFQLPPFLRKDVERMRAFADMLPDESRAVVEFRHASWFDDEVYELLRQREISMCVGDYEGKTSQLIEGGRTPLVPTASLGYLRLREAEYSEDELRGWVDTIRERWPVAYVFFKHEETAPSHAMTLARLSEASET
jgi:uncharacterized protein YecE (DUF72 family)